MAGVLDFMENFGLSLGDAAARKAGFAAPVAAAAPAVASAVPAVAGAIPAVAGTAAKAAPGAVLGAAGGPIGLAASIGIGALSDAIARNKEKDIAMAEAQGAGAAKIGTAQTSALGNLMAAYKGLA